MLLHLEQLVGGIGTVVESCVFHVEQEGTFRLPPASIELMYQPEKYGYSKEVLLHARRKR